MTGSPAGLSFAERTEEEEFVQAGKTVIDTEALELRGLAERIDATFSSSILMLREALARGRKTLVIGVGKSENVATKIAATLNSTGAPAVVLDCQNALHGDLGLVSEGDVVLALSYSGETNEMLDLLPHLRRRGAKLIAVTGQPQSTLGRFSDLTLNVRATSEACPLNLAPTCSTTNMLALGDALAMVLLKARGFRAEDFAELHPSGSLGRRLLTRVRDIMRTDGQLAFARSSDSIAEVLAAMTRCKAGAALVVDEMQILEGIFTHGDFARCYQTSLDISSHPVSRYMTRNPVSIGQEKLAEEAIRILAEHKIDELVVLDEARRAVGLVDVQDLSRARIF